MARGKLFGTDGIRGRANSWPMTPDLILNFAMASGSYFNRGQHRHTVVIGKDTRLSGYMVESALTAGFISVGMDVILLGPLPTAAISMLTNSMRADCGVMISASHNPYEDNGLKFFGPDGGKLSDFQEQEIEQLIIEKKFKSVSADSLGKARRLDDAAGRYIEFVKATFPKKRRLDGFKIVVDCAHGSAYKIAPLILWELGAEVISIGVNPDGTNINEKCGATYPQTLSQAVIDHEAHIGIALDGDADRLIVVDELGRVIDGDQIMATIAVHMKKNGQLKNDTLVTTQMSNLGLEHFLNNQGIQVLRANVGDRYVLSMMQQYGANLGGEKSGHIILNDFIPSGDGTIAALKILDILSNSGLKASECLSGFVPVPQVLKSIVLKPSITIENEEIQRVVKKCENMLEGQGILYVRKSGTEPVVRIMAQGNNNELLLSVVNEISQVIETLNNAA